jgi:hypothetical protein
MDSFPIAQVCMQEADHLLAMSVSEAASSSMVTVLRLWFELAQQYSVKLSYAAAPHKVRLASVESNLLGIAHQA